MGVLDTRLREYDIGRALIYFAHFSPTKLGIGSIASKNPLCLGFFVFNGLRNIGDLQGA